MLAHIGAMCTAARKEWTVGRRHSPGVPTTFQRQGALGDDLVVFVVPVAGMEPVVVTVVLPAVLDVTVTLAIPKPAAVMPDVMAVVPGPIALFPGVAGPRRGNHFDAVWRRGDVHVELDARD